MDYFKFILLCFISANPLGGSCPNPSDAGLLPGVLCSGMYAECLALSPDSYTCQCVTGYYDDNGNTEAGNCRPGTYMYGT